ncbi:hypothetical protein G6F57_014905 [Rhizopus arrhizus]|nr:hypothetical protein G6F57_014905 [Rhizopus arrhizus]
MPPGHCVPPGGVRTGEDLAAQQIIKKNFPAGCAALVRGAPAVVEDAGADHLRRRAAAGGGQHHLQYHHHHRRVVGVVLRGGGGAAVPDRHPQAGIFPQRAQRRRRDPGARLGTAAGHAGDGGGVRPAGAGGRAGCWLGTAGAAQYSDPHVRGKLNGRQGIAHRVADLGLDPGGAVRGLHPAADGHRPGPGHDALCRRRGQSGQPAPAAADPAGRARGRQHRAGAAGHAAGRGAAAGRRRHAAAGHRVQGTSGRGGCTCDAGRCATPPEVGTCQRGPGGGAAAGRTPGRRRGARDQQHVRGGRPPASAHVRTDQRAGPRRSRGSDSGDAGPGADRPARARRAFGVQRDGAGGGAGCLAQRAGARGAADRGPPAGAVAAGRQPRGGVPQ